MTAEAEGIRTAAQRDVVPVASTHDAAPHKRSRDELFEEAALVRRELAATLDAIEDKLNVPKQIARVSKSPIAIGAMALTAAAVVGVGVWALVRTINRR